MKRSYSKIDVKNSSQGDLVVKYIEIMKLVPKTIPQQVTNLKQPSLLEEVDSITTYGVVGISKGNNA